MPTSSREPPLVDCPVSEEFKAGVLKRFPNAELTASGGPGDPSMSERLMRIIGVQALQDATHKECRMLLEVAHLAWNIGTDELAGRWEKANAVRKTFEAVTAAMGSEVSEFLRGELEHYISKRKEMFPDDLRRVIEVTVSETDTMFLVTAAVAQPE